MSRFCFAKSTQRVIGTSPSVRTSPSMKLSPSRPIGRMNAPAYRLVSRWPQQLHELIEHADARTAGVDKARDALIDADRIGIGKAQRPVGVHVDVDPAGAQIVTGHIDDFGVRSDVPRAHKLNLAVGDMDVRDPVDSLFGVEDMRPFQNKRIGRGIHA